MKNKNTRNEQDISDQMYTPESSASQKDSRRSFLKKSSKGLALSAFSMVALTNNVYASGTSGTHEDGATQNKTTITRWKVYRKSGQPLAYVKEPDEDPQISGKNPPGDHPNTISVNGCDIPKFGDPDPSGREWNHISTTGSAPPAGRVGTTPTAGWTWDGTYRQKTVIEGRRWKSIQGYSSQ